MPLFFIAWAGWKFERSLLSPEHHTGLGSIARNDATSQQTILDGLPIATCLITDTSGYNYCGITIFLGKKPKDGQDFTPYNNIDIEIEIEIIAPVEQPRVRFSLRNFNDSYSDINDYISLKFNSIKYAPSEYKKSINVPLKFLSCRSLVDRAICHWFCPLPIRLLKYILC
ncbi:hypothetical protein QX776_00200 [Alteromonadaceae bacterium BrNp21-10]|nr:hypothetical protein [Alteromonadaceae bacterium BrNp21-10]